MIHTGLHLPHLNSLYCVHVHAFSKIHSAIYFFFRHSLDIYIFYFKQKALHKKELIREFSLKMSLLYLSLCPPQNWNNNLFGSFRHS